jgi:hypothetical protein
MRTIVTLALVFLLVLSMSGAGCMFELNSDRSASATKTPAAIQKTPSPAPAKTVVPAKTATVKKTTAPTKTAALKGTTVPIPAATWEPINITEGFWCRDTTMNIGKASTDVRECYQFFDDGTYRWGYQPGWPMGKSTSCPGDPSEPCRYFLNGRGQYEVEGGYDYTLSGISLIDPHNPPYYTWSETGIP